MEVFAVWTLAACSRPVSQPSTIGFASPGAPSAADGRAAALPGHSVVPNLSNRRLARTSAPAVCSREGNQEITSLTLNLNGRRGGSCNHDPRLRTLNQDSHMDLRVHQRAVLRALNYLMIRPTLLLLSYSPIFEMVLLSRLELES